MVVLQKKTFYNRRLILYLQIARKMQLHKVLVTVLLLFIGYNIIEVLGRESVSNTAENPLITVEELKQLMKVRLLFKTYYIQKIIALSVKPILIE